MNLPPRALSVRQPWAWAIMHAGKTIENRSWRSYNPGIKFRGPVCIHASSGLGREEYEDAADSIRQICGKAVPPARDLPRGAIVGTVEIVDVVTDSQSPWFFGRIGLVLRNPRPITPIPAGGQLGFFSWKPHAGDLVEPAKWMLPKAETVAKPKAEPETLPLFGDR
jgi:hypothetical protein